MKTLSCGFHIDHNLFKIYALDTARLFVELFPWFYMPQSVHKVLSTQCIHGHLIISRMLLPIGMLSEEPQESRNKELKRFREHHTRKISRTATNMDLLHLLLVTSDPVISSLRKPIQTKRITLTGDMLALLSAADIPSLLKQTAFSSGDNLSCGNEPSDDDSDSVFNRTFT